MFCPKCGKELEEGDLFCPYCGEPLKGKRRLGIKFWVILGLVLLLLLGGGLSYFFLFPRVNPQASLEKQEKVEKEIEESLSSGNYPQERMGEMVQELEQAVRLNPDNRKAREDLFNLYLLNGEVEKAQRELEELLKRDPGNTYAQEMLQLLKMEGISP